MRLYRITNKGKMPWWMWAENEQEALELSMLGRSAKRIENLSIIGDQTDFYTSPETSPLYFESGQLAADSEAKGFGYVQISGCQTLEEVMSNAPRKPSNVGWVIVHPVTKVKREFFILYDPNKIT